MKIAVVIPCYKVKRQILNVISAIGDEVFSIYVIDDFCPEGTGNIVLQKNIDNRVKVIFHEKNKGVGGAVITGYLKALTDGADVIVKVDGDGQMDPKQIKKLVAPILRGDADYTKGNRFYNIESLMVMPKVRLFGNSVLSLINKIVNGYWNIVDPTNGYTAIHAETLKLLPLNKIDNRYFFESDMLFRLSTLRAVVKDISIEAKYGEEVSNLKISRILFEFPHKYSNRFFKRIFYLYLLKDFNAGTIQLFMGLFLLGVGAFFGLYHWFQSVQTHVVATSGTVMISGLSVILGFQMLLSALNFDIQNTPKEPIQKL